MKRSRSRRLVAAVSGVAAVVSFARVLVLFLEARALVNDEREQDRELLVLCRNGAARGSVKMRSACLQAQADQASPLVLKAIVRAVSTAWGEFYDAVSTPFGAFAVLLFFASSLVLPVVPWARALGAAIGAGDGHCSGDEDLESSHVIVLNGGADFGRRTKARHRLFQNLVAHKADAVRETPRIDVMGGEW
tara:strand:- start:810 stop:1382 length:573 start_codon:yes stop_codon:yes gene_type:complete